MADTTDEKRIPKDRKPRVVMAIAIAVAMLAGLYMAWGFIAPPVDSDEEPVLEDGELPVE